MHDFTAAHGNIPVIHKPIFISLMLMKRKGRMVLKALNGAAFSNNSDSLAFE
jgi:hypothetical protein